jgi:hydrogenase expression/formation protein HypD
LKHIDEYRDRDLVGKLSHQIGREVSRHWNLMEICGGQTHTILKYGLQQLLPEQINLIHGPGCPVCVTPLDMIDSAVQLAAAPGVILASFGDMMRVPGSQGDLLAAKARGGDVRMVYSPLDVLEMAEEHPDREVVFFAVGFETTAPAVALAIKEARKRRLTNFSVLVAHVLVPPAMEVLLNSEANAIEGFLAAGHVCTVMGEGEYRSIAERFRIPIVVTGFEPVDIMLGLHTLVRMLEKGQYGVENAYPRSVKAEGNTRASGLMREVFVPVDRAWRGIGMIPSGGLRLDEAFAAFDASRKFKMSRKVAEERGGCIAGEILTGRKRPPQCEAFGTSCTPVHPIGAPMVSSEGACAAYYSYDSVTK